MIQGPVSRSGDVVIWMVLATSVVVAAHQDPAGLCGSLDRSPSEMVRVLTPLGENGRRALTVLLDAEDRALRLCGAAGLSALGDRRAIPYLVRLLRDSAVRQDAWRVARWAAHLAGGADPDLGPSMLALVDVLDDGATRAATGDDGIALLGEIDADLARDRLVSALDDAITGGAPDATLDAIVHALARQGEPRTRQRIAALGVDAERSKSGNATPEQARRLGAVAFYQLALAPDAVADGLATLGAIAARDQAAAAAWAVETLCARAVRRPADRAAATAHRSALVDELTRRGVAFGAAKGPFGCGAVR
jgi:hypothetical protein